MISEPIIKYPRTRHIEGSNLQSGDCDDFFKMRDIAGRHCVIEEKLDGANSGVSFSGNADLLLQSRGHFLVGGGREKHFDLFKVWGTRNADEFFDRIGDRFIVYGEWMRAKHTVFYDALDALFLEFDVYDKTEKRFLSTPARRKLLDGLPIKSVPVLYEGPMPRSLSDLTDLVGRSTAKSSSWKESLSAVCKHRNLDEERIFRETDQSDLMEGVYVKFEDENTTLDRAKWVRHGFLQIIQSIETHWLSRPLVPNLVVDDPLLNKPQAATPKNRF